MLLPVFEILCRGVIYALIFLTNASIYAIEHDGGVFHANWFAVNVQLFDGLGRRLMEMHDQYRYTIHVTYLDPAGSEFGNPSDEANAPPPPPLGGSRVRLGEGEHFINNLGCVC